ncbi:hypothetical protein PNEG_03227 [Pneumocystis murina B123]|uniref:1-phosphatidylinositol-4-phosphate 5-kinase n=1 Tax=Pneumocystis murina (strain B123) TaxID=1069680 RepID=M7P3H8_PNEMU|nr:hypothetical protein PNEG_03227 [Pneumocystis murina B123]EMR08390.1 hypothetical protein PNEG_03227 [Pneumocystis murina B123]
MGFKESDSLLDDYLSEQSINKFCISNGCDKSYESVKCFEELLEKDRNGEMMTRCKLSMGFPRFLDNMTCFRKNAPNYDTVSTISINVSDTQHKSKISDKCSNVSKSVSCNEQDLKEQNDLRFITSNVHDNKIPDAIAVENKVASSEGCSVDNALGVGLGSQNVTCVSLDVREESTAQEPVKWIETIWQKRSSKHKRKQNEENQGYFIGTRIGEDHVNYVTAYNMLTGIRVGVSRCTAKVDRDLTSIDFVDSYKFSFDITGNELTPSAKYDFKFKDYSPWVFRHLRALFRLDPADYLISLTSKYILSELGSPGKSGSFFYFSRDYRYIIKTIHHSEHKFLRKILRQYYEHVKKNPNTLISQFYGLHRVKMPYGHKIHFVIMNNLFPPHRDIHKTFDLKGSTVGRDYKEDDLEKNPRATMKDLNWIRRKMYLSLGPEKRDIFLAQVKADIELLESLDIMDYSLLVGIHDLSLGNKEHIRGNMLSVFNPDSEQIHSSLKQGQTVSSANELRKIVSTIGPVSLNSTSNELSDPDFTRKDFIFYSDDGGFRATQEDNLPGDSIYYIGIIDLLTKYNIVKKVEHFWKGLSHSKSQVSAIPPSGYASRFFKFISSIIKTHQSVEI